MASRTYGATGMVRYEAGVFGVEFGLGVEIGDRADEGRAELAGHEAARDREGGTIGLQIFESPQEAVACAVGGEASEQRCAGLRRMPVRTAMDEEESVGV